MNTDAEGKELFDKQSTIALCNELLLSALVAALPGVDLCHISPAAVVDGDLLHIHSLLELLAELSHSPEGSQTVE
eukprot:gene12038-12181_t